MSTNKSLGVLLVLIGLLSACGEDPKPKAQAVDPSAASVAAATNLAADPLAPRYESSLAEGIDFKKPGYPSFLAEVSGMSGREDWGRWTDGPVAKFRFKQPLPGKFTLLINAGAIGPNFGKPILVRAGKVERKFTAKNPAATTPPGVATFALSFDGVDGTDTIEIVPPKPTRPKDMDPKSDDERMLGVGMVSLKLQ
jgi:phosphoglycerol transferase